MAPTPGAFGAWSCQPISVIYLARDKDASVSGNEADDGAASLASFENRVNAVAAAAAAADEVGRVARLVSQWLMPRRAACSKGAPWTSQKSAK
jgi:hypothetical protein